MSLRDWSSLHCRHMDWSSTRWCLERQHCKLNPLVVFVNWLTLTAFDIVKWIAWFTSTSVRANSVGTCLIQWTRIVQALVDISTGDAIALIASVACAHKRAVCVGACCEWAARVIVALVDVLIGILISLSKGHNVSSYLVPVHVTPSPSYPVLHVQLYEPGVLEHEEYELQYARSHSLMSKWWTQC